MADFRQQSLNEKGHVSIGWAPYKLAKNKLPFSACEESFAVLKHMASSKNTIATKTFELHQKVLQPELEQKIHPIGH